MEDEKGKFVSNGMPPGKTAWFRQVTAGMDIIKIISESKAFGATGIKIHSGVSAPLLKQLSLEAHRQGLKVWSHASIGPSQTGDAVAAGVDVLSHADMIRDVLSFADMMEFPVQSDAVTRLLKQMKNKGVILEPTLFIIAFFESQARDEANRQRLKRHLGYAYQITRRAKEMGVTIVTGSDNIGGASPNIHAELQLLVNKGGLSPLEVITAATRNGARAIGIEKDYGTLEKGRVADLVVLGANPAADIRNTQTIEYVMQGGKLYKREQPLRTPPLAEPPLQVTGTQKN